MTWQDIPGHFNFSKLYDEMLDQWDSERPFAMAEVGVYLGRSAAYMALEARKRHIHLRLYAIDLWPGSMYDQFWRNMQELELTTCVIGGRGVSWESAGYFQDGELDFVFIDAAHDYDSVTKDIKAWLPKVRLGGIIAGHDIKHPPVKQAVIDAFGNDWVERHKCWMVQR
jgi:predicted O-methyltransferase YrrM